MFKHLILGLASAAAIAAPLASATAAHAQYGGGYYGQRDGRYDNNRNNNPYDNRYDNRRGGYDNRYDDRRGGYDNRRDNDRRWDNNRYNGYYLGNTWYWGEPRVSYYDRYDYRPGYRQWARGSYIPRGFPVYVVNDWQRYRLRPPPRGYHWVYSNNNYLLAAIATGLIAEVIASR